MVWQIKKSARPGFVRQVNTSTGGSNDDDDDTPGTATTERPEVTETETNRPDPSPTITPTESPDVDPTRTTRTSTRPTDTAPETSETDAPTSSPDPTTHTTTTTSQSTRTSTRTTSTPDPETTTIQSTRTTTTSTPDPETTTTQPTRTTTPRDPETTTIPSTTSVRPPVTTTPSSSSNIMTSTVETSTTTAIVTQNTSTSTVPSTIRTIITVTSTSVQQTTTQNTAAPTTTTVIPDPTTTPTAVPTTATSTFVPETTTSVVPPTTTSPAESTQNTVSTSSPIDTSSISQRPEITTTPTTSSEASTELPVTTSNSVIPSSSSTPSITTSDIPSSSSPTSIPPTSSHTTAQQETTSTVETTEVTTTPLQPETSSQRVIVTSRETITSPATTRPIAQSTATEVATFTTTDASGSTFLTAPEFYTTVFTSQSDGEAITVTQVVAQGTGSLRTNDGKGGNNFFGNKPAVAGVFVIVGIAGAAIVLFGIFTYMNRRKAARIRRDALLRNAIASQRTPFADEPDDDDSAPSGRTDMGYRQGNPMPLYGTNPGGVYSTQSTYGGQSINSGTSTPWDQRLAPHHYAHNHPPPNPGNNWASGPTPGDGYGPFSDNNALAPGPQSPPHVPVDTPLLSDHPPLDSYSYPNAGNGPVQGSSAGGGGGVGPTSGAGDVSYNPELFEYDYPNYLAPSTDQGALNNRFSFGATGSQGIAPPPPGAANIPPPPGAAYSLPPSYAQAYHSALPAVPTAQGGIAALPTAVYQKRTSMTPSSVSAPSVYSLDNTTGNDFGTIPMSALGKKAGSSSHGHNTSSSSGAFLGSGKQSSQGHGSGWHDQDDAPPFVDQRLDPEKVLGRKGVSQLVYASSNGSEESLRDDRDYSRRVLQVTNAS